MFSADYDLAEVLFPELLTVGDLAEVMATNVEVVEGWIADEQLPCVRVASEVRFKPEDVKRFVLERQDLYGAN